MGGNSTFRTEKLGSSPTSTVSMDGMAGVEEGGLALAGQDKAMSAPSANPAPTSHSQVGNLCQIFTPVSPQLA